MTAHTLVVPCLARGRIDAVRALTVSRVPRICGARIAPNRSRVTHRAVTSCRKRRPDVMTRPRTDMAALRT